MLLKTNMDCGFSFLSVELVVSPHPVQTATLLPSLCQEQPQSHQNFRFAQSLLLLLLFVCFFHQIVSLMTARSFELSTKPFSRLFPLTTSPFTFFPRVQIPFGKAHLSWLRNSTVSVNNTVSVQSPSFRTRQIGHNNRNWKRCERLRRRENLSLRAMMWFPDVCVQY